jgi:hypothetical protein
MATNSQYYDYDKKEWSACGQVTDWTCLSCFLGKSMQVRHPPAVGRCGSSANRASYAGPGRCAAREAPRGPTGRRRRRRATCLPHCVSHCASQCVSSLLFRPLCRARRRSTCRGCGRAGATCTRRTRAWTWTTAWWGRGPCASRSRSRAPTARRATQCATRTSAKRATTRPRSTGCARCGADPL